MWFDHVLTTNISLLFPICRLCCTPSRIFRYCTWTFTHPRLSLTLFFQFSTLIIANNGAFEKEYLGLPINFGLSWLIPLILDHYKIISKIKLSSLMWFGTVPCTVYPFYFVTLFLLLPVSKLELSSVVGTSSDVRDFSLYLKWPVPVLFGPTFACFHPECRGRGYKKYQIPARHRFVRWLFWTGSGTRPFPETYQKVTSALPVPSWICLGLRERPLKLPWYWLKEATAAFSLAFGWPYICLFKI